MKALEELLLNISRLVVAYPAIEELDLNPVRVFEHGLMALDVRLITKPRMNGLAVGMTQGGPC